MLQQRGTGDQKRNHTSGPRGFRAERGEVGGLLGWIFRIRYLRISAAVCMRVWGVWAWQAVTLHPKPLS